MSQTCEQFAPRVTLSFADTGLIEKSINLILKIYRERARCQRATLGDHFRRPKNPRQSGAKDPDQGCGRSVSADDGLARFVLAPMFSIPEVEAAARVSSN